MYSAVKYRGKPLYKLARAGITIERKARAARIHSIDTSRAKRLPGVVAAVTGHDAPEGRFGEFYLDHSFFFSLLPTALRAGDVIAWLGLVCLGTRAAVWFAWERGLPGRDLARGKA
jgi:CO/xanthine dehydrogenase Mo-binding subunit